VSIFGYIEELNKPSARDLSKLVFLFFIMMRWTSPETYLAWRAGLLISLPSTAVKKRKDKERSFILGIGKREHGMGLSWLGRILEGEDEVYICVQKEGVWVLSWEFVYW
jgi:hypothetical protein